MPGSSSFTDELYYEVPLSSRDVMTLRLEVIRICLLVQQHEASTSGQKMVVARLLRHFSTRASLPSHLDLHTIGSGLTRHERTNSASFTHGKPGNRGSRQL